MPTFTDLATSLSEKISTRCHTSILESLPYKHFEEPISAACVYVHRPQGFTLASPDPPPPHQIFAARASLETLELSERGTGGGIGAHPRCMLVLSVRRCL